MKEGLQKSSGHFMELRKLPSKPWGDKYGGFFYCTQCNKFAWGWDAICPNKTIKVSIPAEVLV